MYIRWFLTNREEIVVTGRSCRAVTGRTIFEALCLRMADVAASTDENMAELPRENHCGHLVPINYTRLLSDGITETPRNVGWSRIARGGTPSSSI
jgi:hypothetical protein